jgi:hypothetical protein
MSAHGHAVCRASVLGAVLLVSMVCTGRAQSTNPGLSFGWTDCRSSPGTGGLNRLFGCGFTLVDIPLFPAVRLAEAIDSVLSVELVIDVDIATDALPPWWRMEPGGCHSSPSGWGAALATTSSCLDPWAGQGSASIQGWHPGTPGGAPMHGRLLAAVGTLPGTLATLPAGDALALCRLALRGDNTLTCSGCTIPACLVFNSITIRRLPGSIPEEITISNEESFGSAHVFWQDGTGADCQAVPTRRSTWGAVKSLYR